jgi:hypothetical protein
MAEEAGVVAEEEEGGEDFGPLDRKVHRGPQDQKGGKEDGGGGEDAEGAAEIEAAEGDVAGGLFFREQAGADEESADGEEEIDAELAVLVQPTGVEGPRRRMESWQSITPKMTTVRQPSRVGR